MSAEVPARPRRRRPRLSDEAAEHVRELIVSGQLEPGQFIRPETMAAELDISATPMREGLLTLQSEGLLRVEPRRGFMVAPLSANDIEDVFVGQSLLAGELAARATSRMSSCALVRATRRCRWRCWHVMISVYTPAWTSAGERLQPWAWRGCSAATWAW